MALAAVQHFLEQTSQDPGSLWKMPELVSMASRPPPDDMLQWNGAMLRADAYAIWFRWFVEGLCNPLRYVGDETKTIIDILADTMARVDEIYPREPRDERRMLAQGIAQRISLEVERRRQLGRVGASKVLRRELVDVAGGVPRCYICGFRFGAEAVDKFMARRTGVRLILPAFVDVLRPRGLYDRDVAIEVDHVIPVAGGGGGHDNLALACGWCNKSKGARTSIYDADGRPPRSTYMLGMQTWHELPHPFWTVRIIATRARCEHESGCDARPHTAELFIAPGDHRGSPNPSNLHVYCSDHDPYASHRFYGRETARRIWVERAKATA